MCRSWLMANRSIRKILTFFPGELDFLPGVLTPTRYRIGHRPSFDEIQEDSGLNQSRIYPCDTLDDRGP